MARKLIYLNIAGRDECVEFSTSDLPSDIAGTVRRNYIKPCILYLDFIQVMTLCPYVAGLFAAAAEAGPTDILKLYTTTGNLVRISGTLPANTPQTRYKLELAAVQDNGWLLFRILYKVNLIYKCMHSKLMYLYMV
jgi:hypothetical protein